MAWVVHSGFTGATVYINGTEASSTSNVDSQDPESAPGDLVIGRSTTNGDYSYLSVEVDELSFWDVALTAEQVEDIFEMHS